MKSDTEKTLEGLIHIPTLKLRLAVEGILVGLFAGGCIAVLRSCLEYVSQRRSLMVAFLQQAPLAYILAWVVILLCLAILIAFMVKCVPDAGGGGIPRIRGIVIGVYESFHWFRVIVVKLITTALGIGAGLSMGREGPSVQIGGMTGQGVGQLFHNSNAETRILISSGAGAGLAAAFNAPMAGCLFTMEVIHKNLSSLVMLPMLMASLTAAVVAHAVFGMDTVFAIPKMPILNVRYLPHLVVLGLFTGAMGVLFNKCSTNIGRFYALPVFKKPWMKIAFALLLTIPLTYLFPAILGAGDGIIEDMVDLKGTVPLLLALLTGKYIFTVLSTGSGAPGGSLQPMLVLGAVCGALYGNIAVSLGLLPAACRLHMVVFAMAGFFTGSVRAPVTAILLLLELTGRFYHMVPLGIVTLFAYAAGELLHDEPVFDAALEADLAKHRPPQVNEGLRTNRYVVETAVESGSYAENKSLKEIVLPGKALVIGVRRGENTMVPDASMVLLSGDYVYILPNQAEVPKINALFTSKNK
jgi:H+/Cl- antiporter ClcA